MNKGNKRTSNVASLKGHLNTVETKLEDGIFTFSGPLTISEFATKIKKKPCWNFDSLF
ncbi:hypothetical protein JPM7_5700 [Metamycoplasma equirhinis]|nr:hypothetical protein JPM7_5700 [Metamycoplasma equirhinis]